MRRGGSGLVCRAALGLAVSTGAAFAPSRAADANSSGIPGYSGKTASMSCDACHGGGTQAPTVMLTGPVALAAGQTGTFTVDVVSAAATAKVSGIDVASSASPAPATVGGDEWVSSGEVVQSAPQPFSTGRSSWQFTWTAPTAGGSYTLFTAAVAANQDGTAAGDAANRAALTVVVAAPVDMAAPRDLAPPPPDLTVPPDLFGVDQSGLDFATPPDLSPPDDLSASPDALSSASWDLAMSPASDGGAPPSKTSGKSEARWGCGCATAGTGASTDTLPARLPLDALLVAFTLAASTTRRRRR